MYIPLQLRLTLFYTLVLGMALWFFGYTVYMQAEQQAYSDLDNTLSSRAASVRLGKTLMCSNPAASSVPCTLPSVDGLGTGGVAIEVLDENMHLLATTTGTEGDFLQTTVGGLGTSPIPWDEQAVRRVLQHPVSGDGSSDSLYSTILYQGQHVRVYTLINNDLGSLHIIQTARSEQDIEQSLADLQTLLLRGGALVLAFALVGGWFITWGVLSAVRGMTKTAQSISTSRNFSQRVPGKTWLGRDELAILATTFNEMLANLEELYQQQQRFVADASHELRAPITSIRCNLDLLAKAPDLPAQEAQAALADARAEANRMGRLVSDLLALARSDAIAQAERTGADGYRKENGQKQLVDLDSLLLEVFRQYQPVGENGNSETKQQGPRLLLQLITPVKVYGDADQLKQVLVALLDNALKYTPYEGTVSLSLTTTEDSAIVKVSDTGIGISPQDLPHIFERFYRADRARSRERGGSGLGLTIVQSIVREHQGSIEVESTPGKGSTFVLMLPVAM
ncbi:MAG: sensor histidine kinase [Ktedonobacteraceae bacterium]